MIKNLLREPPPHVLREILAREKMFKEQSLIMKANKRAELESNSDYQRRKRMTHEERARHAIETQTKNIMERKRWQGEIMPSYEDTKSEVIDRAERLKNSDKF